MFIKCGHKLDFELKLSFNNVDMFFSLPLIDFFEKWTSLYGYVYRFTIVKLSILLIIKSGIISDSLIGNSRVPKIV